VKVLDGGPEPREARFTTALLHDDPNLRIVAFHLLPGQEVPPHHSPSTVSLQVTEGAGWFRGGDGEARLEVGQTIAYAPGETHAIRADDGPLRFLAFIAPRPG
jgi:quercetin dioxygenase-like cupin family protein